MLRRLNPWRVTALAAFLLSLTTTPAVAWNPFQAAGDAVGGALKSGGKSLGQGLGQGAVEAIQPALVSTITTASAAASSLVADVDTRLTRQVDHAGGVASRLVSETKGAVDDSLGKVDHILEKRLLQVEVAANGVVRRLDGAVARNLDKADTILKERSAQLGEIVSSSIQQADHALEQRIAQLDEAVALRLGNVDVIASKQRIGIEETAVRIGVLLALLVFVVIVLRTVWQKYVDVQARAGEEQGVRRVLVYLASFGRPVLLQVMAAGIVVAILYALYDQLPLGARAQAADLAAMHRRAMKDSLARFDFSRVRFHASQLEVLLPEDGAYYQAMEGKAELLRDLVMRPALLATEQGVSQIVERVQALERRMGTRADPDVLTMKALVLWQVGDSKRDEHAAASYCARALRLSAGGFALAPLARHYIRAFMHAPYVEAGSGYGRDRESLQDLRVLASAPVATDDAFPLAQVIALNRLIFRLDRESVPAYLDMLKAHAEVSRLAGALSRVGERSRAPDTAELAAVRKQRGEAATRVLAAWRKFEDALDDVPGLSGKSAVLAIFRLNDAGYTRAAWFVEQPQSNDLAPLLAEVADLDLRARLAPPRIRWEKRYGRLIATELHGVAELQEATRFAEFERRSRDFERAYVGQAVAVPGPEKDSLRRIAAVAAAKLGLYVSDPIARRRRPLAATLITDSDEKDAATAAALAEALQTRGMRTL